jgi:hypothetical protein
MRTTNAQFLRKRKFLLVLPLLVIPFLLIFFYVLGVGKKDNSNSLNQKPAGLNTRLPDAQFKKAKEKSKMGLYEEMMQDSARILEKMKADPFYMINRDDSENSVDQVEEKLEALKKIMHSSPPPESIPISKIPEKTEPEPQPAKPRNADLDQINSMLDKVMAIQHPQILQDSLAKVAKEHQPFSYAVELNKPSPESNNRFYDLAQNISFDNELNQSIEAEVAETQILITGSTIKLRLLNEVVINGHVMARDQSIYGTVMLQGERLKIKFSSIRAGKFILPIALEAYDLDGLAGVYIPGSMERESVKSSADQTISSIGMNGLDPSLAAQAASAGIQTAKTLITHRVKLTKVTLPAGYHLLLKESKN